MKICLAQSHSVKGNVDENIKNHIELIKHAINLQTGMVMFPELSITGYEPQLVNDLAVSVDSQLFIPFQQLADENNIVIGIGVPIKIANGINISTLIFQPNKKRDVYAKQILHADELPYFVVGQDQLFLNFNGTKIA